MSKNLRFFYAAKKSKKITFSIPNYSDMASLIFGMGASLIFGISTSLILGIFCYFTEKLATVWKQSKIIKISDKLSINIL